MATKKRRTEPSLNSQPQQPLPGNDDFFQLVRLAERLASASVQAGDFVPVGMDGPPKLESIRFHATTGSAFSGSAVERVQTEDAAGDALRYRMGVTFMGLTGPAGAMPRHYTTLVQERIKQRDSALADFLDLFNHRLISLFYRAWAKYRLVIQEEHARISGERNAMTRVLRGLSGQPSSVGQAAGLYYAGHLSRRVRSAKSLEQLLGDFLRLPVRVEMFVGQWLAVQAQDRVRLGSGQSGQNNHLGAGVLLGHRVWDIQSKLCIHIGPVTVAEHQSLLPDTETYKTLQELVGAYLPCHLNVDLQFDIREHHPSQRKQLGQGLRNGWNTWLKSGPAGTRSATVRLYPPSAH